jgi:prepilin-type N-terminal cleavage/methylation domain-containing protein
MTAPRVHLRAFTLTELLVVISVIVLLIAIALPAFSNLVRNSEQSLADNQLKIAVGLGRDAAIRSAEGDGAAVFLFEPGGRIVVVPCVQVGRPLLDEVMSGPSPAGIPPRERDVFVPVPEVEPLVIPKGWSVRAYAPPGAISPTGAQATGWYENFTTRSARTNNWVFPETGFTRPADDADASVGVKGWQRQSFMVRFKAGSGELDTSGREALVLDPLPVTDSLYRQSPPWDSGGGTLARQLAMDPARFARMVMNRDDAAMPVTAKARLLGDRGGDTILCRGVTELALYREASLASALGVGVNRETGTLYAPVADDTTGPVLDPALVNRMQAADQDEAMGLIGDWIVGRLVRSGRSIESDAKVYTLERYLGHVREIVPLAPGEVTP